MATKVHVSEIEEFLSMSAEWFKFKWHKVQGSSVLWILSSPIRLWFTYQVYEKNYLQGHQSHLAPIPDYFSSTPLQKCHLLWNCHLMSLCLNWHLLIEFVNEWVAKSDFFCLCLQISPIGNSNKQTRAHYTKILPRPWCWVSCWKAGWENPTY